MLMSTLACHSQKKMKGNNAASNAKPNILFILVDDFGWRDIAGTGSDFYETPNMDKLIGQGMNFTQAYSSYPRCVPSRYSIMTGQHPARVNTEKGESGFKVEESSETIGKVMHDAGYFTFYLGKWHLGGEEHEPKNVGFDLSVAAGGAGATASHFAPYNVDKSGRQPKEDPIQDLDDAPEGENLEDRLTDETIKILKANKDKTFFGILAHYAVHTPIQGKAEYIQYFKEKLKKNPPKTGPAYEPESAGDNKLKQDHATYAAMIKAVDDGIGKIMKTLEEEGLDKNTIIILTSDHGGLSARGNTREVATTNRPLRAGKGHLYEGGIRVPLFVKWNGVINPGSSSNAPIFGADHYQTVLDIAGGKVPQDRIEDGKSYLPVLKGGSADMNRTLYWHNPAPRPKSTGDLYSSAIREGDYKLLDFYADGKVELYNLKEDMGEYHNIAEANPEITAQMMKKLEAWRNDVGAVMKVKPKDTLAGLEAAEANKNAGAKEKTPAQIKAQKERMQQRKNAKN